MLHAHAAAYDDATSHDAAHHAAAHDVATATAAASVLQHDDAETTIHGWPESAVQQNGGSAHGAQLMKGRGR